MPLLMLMSTAITVLMHSYRRDMADVLPGEGRLGYGDKYVIILRPLHGFVTDVDNGV